MQKQYAEGTSSNAEEGKQSMIDAKLVLLGQRFQFIILLFLIISFLLLSICGCLALAFHLLFQI